MKRKTTWREGVPWLGLLFGSGRDERPLEERAPHLPSSEQFREMLRKEMHRSDRTLSPLTVLLFDVESADREAEKARYEEELLRLAELVPSCLRNTDSAGWFRDGHGLRLGVLLYHTAPLMAERVIEDVRRRFKVGHNGENVLNGKANGHGAEPEIACEIMAYPGPGITEREAPQQLSLFGGGEGERGGHHGDGRNGAAGDGTGRIALRQRLAVRRQDIRKVSPVVVRCTEAHPLMAREVPGWKRVLDIFGATVGLIVLSPLLIAAAAAVRLSSPGPIFFKQDRVGHTGRIYKCWKFRTMTHGCDTSRHRQYIKSLIKGGDRAMVKLDSGESQITRVGNLLRKTSIDELPQIFNVLKGEMSLVGPRPCLPYEAEEFLRWHTRRFDILPGITGLWQVSGKNDLTFKEMIRLDITYARKMSLWFDLKIIFMTIPTIVHETRKKSAAAKLAQVEAAQADVHQPANTVEVHHA